MRTLMVRKCSRPKSGKRVDDDDDDDDGGFYFTGRCTHVLVVVAVFASFPVTPEKRWSDRTHTRVVRIHQNALIAGDHTKDLN